MRVHQMQDHFKTQDTEGPEPSQPCHSQLSDVGNTFYFCDLSFVKWGTLILCLLDSGIMYAAAWHTEAFSLSSEGTGFVD